MFVKGALVKTILDVTNGFAYIQNADTNSYIENNFVKKSAVYTATPDSLSEVIRKAQAGATIQLSAGAYGLLELRGIYAYPENLTILGGEGVTMAGISITSGVKDQEINSAYYNLAEYNCANTDLTNAALPKGLTIQDITFTDSFSLRNASFEDLSIIGCVFSAGTYLYVDPNRMMDVYGGDFTAEKHNFETRPFFAKLTPKNLIVRECVFEDATPLNDGSTHIEKNASAILVKGVCGITIYKNTVKGAAYNGVQIGGNDITIYNNFSSGEITITNNTFVKTSSRGIRLSTIENANVIALKNQFVRCNAGNTKDLIKASGCKNTMFHWDSTGNNTGAGSNYVPVLDDDGNVVYTEEAVAEIAKRLTTATGGGIVVDGCTGTEADHIVAQGTSGAWTYRKWASGLAECWGCVTLVYGNEYCLSHSMDFPFPMRDIVASMTITNTGFQVEDLGALILDYDTTISWADINFALLKKEGGFEETESMQVAVRIIGSWE